MEMLTHKKKIDAAKQKAIDLHHDFTKAAKHHYQQADAMEKKHGSDHPKTKMHRNIGRHMLQASDKLKYHPDGIEVALGRANAGNNLAKYYSDPSKPHHISGMANRTSKLHKALSSAHSAHQNAIKNSPAGKLKSLGNKIKSKLAKESNEDKEMKIFKEISQGLKTKYYKKAVATNRHGNTQMKVDTARHFGKPGDAKKAQDRADSVRSKMATARPAKEDSDAVKAFLAKGGKIKKLPPGKAAGWHGKDDSGKDVHGMIDKPDIKAMPTRKKIGSMK
jgi:hypothetical protein